MPGRQFVGTGYKYGFNGKENDNEVKGTGNSVDFGARIYDPRIGRWFTVDPNDKAYPESSPYVGIGNNPLFYIDPTGGFLIDVHRRIVQKAFFEMRKTLTKDQNAYRHAILGNSMYSSSVAAPDVRALPKALGGGGHESVDVEHFDNMAFGQIVSNFEAINKKVDATLLLYKSGKITASGLGDKVGEYFHAIQDFYSHSNYIELYEKVYGQTDIKKIPTLQEALSQDAFKDFAAILKTDLKTGKYPADGAGSHKDMNHDLGAGSSYWYLPEVAGKTVNWNSKAAEEVAKKATIDLNVKVENEIK